MPKLHPVIVIACGIFAYSVGRAASSLDWGIAAYCGALVLVTAIMSRGN